MNKLPQIAGIVLICSSLLVAGNSFAGGIAAANPAPTIGMVGGGSFGKPGPVLRILFRLDHIVDAAIARRLGNGGPVVPGGPVADKVLTPTAALR